MNWLLLLAGAVAVSIGVAVMQTGRLAILTATLNRSISTLEGLTKSSDELDAIRLDHIASLEDTVAIQNRTIEACEETLTIKDQTIAILRDAAGLDDQREQLH